MMKALIKKISHLFSFFLPKERKGFIDTDKDGVNTRYEILFRDSSYCTMTKNKSKKISIKGSWKCKYTHVVITNPSKIDIDHIVPANYARENKIGLWSQETFTLFENDPFNLVAVQSSINRSKGDKGLSEWKPPKNKNWYEKRFKDVCDKWGISCPEEPYTARQLVLCPQEIPWTMEQLEERKLPKPLKT